MYDNKICYSRLEPFEFSVSYIDGNASKIISGRSQHIHEECEIYINLSGDVSFMVEDRIYPISTGSIIITRPYEYHHCIYNSQKQHKHFWILFSSKGNEKLLVQFFNRKSGEGNLLKLSPENTEELINLCHSMCESKNNIDGYLKFFKLLSLLESGTSVTNLKATQKEIEGALDYINKHLAEPITVKEVALANHTSVNTLERKFEKILKTTPYKYIKNKRLANAVKLLSDGESVTDVATKSGFSDCSAFITLFKKTYGLTPLKYKQQIENK